ncbi:MAG: amidohydrolase family protein [Gemmatimonadota bacterium]
MAHRYTLLRVLAPSLLAIVAVAAPVPTHGQNAIAFVGGTIIDGRGGPPIAAGTLVVAGGEILAVGPAGTVAVPAGARVIDATGRYLMPGMVDTNVHTSIYGTGATLDAYRDRLDLVVQEAAQLHLKHGVTTIRDSYGTLGPLLQVRDAIARGDVVGPRMMVAGNIVGWGGPCSVSYSLIRESDCDLGAQQFNDMITRGSDEDLMMLTAGELRVAFNEYLDLDPDHIRYGGSSHFTPAFIGFSPDAQRVIVAESHRRGRAVETHSTTPEALRVSILAGIDIVQHPESMDRDMPDALVSLIVERGVICALRTSPITGQPWRAFEASRQAAAAAQTGAAGRPPTRAELRLAALRTDPPIAVRRRNAQKLIRAGCNIAVGSDNYLGAAPEFRTSPKPPLQDPGVGTLHAIEGLVELGMTPSQAIVAATRNGALAARASDRFGTLEPGRLADVLVLAADPLADISNLRTIVMVMKEGVIVDHDALPTQPLWYGRGPR